MNVLKILRYIVGETEFKAGGGFTERFINLCAENGVVLKDVKLSEKMITGFVKASDYKRAFFFSRRSGMRMRCVNKSGLYFFLKAHRKRVGLAVSFVVFALLMAVSSMFIWSVEVTGTQNVNQEIVKDVLSQLGVQVGARKKSIDFKSVQTEAMIKLNSQVSWLAVNIKGTKAVVEVRDFVARKDSETYSYPCNIVADIDGLVLSAEAYNGHLSVKEGNAVRRGDLLISGIVENRDTSAQFMEARGTVTVLREYEFSEKFSVAKTQKKFNSFKTRYSLNIFGITVPLGLFKKSDTDYEDFISQKSLTYKNAVLPFSLIRHTRAYYAECENKNVSYEASADNFTKSCFQSTKNSLVISQSIKAKKADDGIIFSAKNKCIDFCGKKQKIESKAE